MNLLAAVVSELAEFAYQSIFSPAPKKTSEILVMPEPEASLVFQLPIEDVEEAEVNQAFKSLGEVLAERDVTTKMAAKSQEVTPETPTFAGGEVVVASPHTPLYMRPTKEFDAVLEVLEPGRTLKTISFNGRWVEVAHKGGSGWVRIDAVVEHAGVVYPAFVVREYCGPESTTTEKVRAIIADMFEAGRAELPLRGEEYVAYRLKKQGVSLPETNIRPRTAGDWGAIFKGKHGVHISLRPKTGAVMEYCTKANECMLAYVEAVFPDESISVSEVGSPEDGYYDERVMTREAWQELRPAFLQFS